MTIAELSYLIGLAQTSKWAFEGSTNGNIARKLQKAGLVEISLDRPGEAFRIDITPAGRELVAYLCKVAACGLIVGLMSKPDPVNPDLLQTASEQE